MHKFCYEVCLTEDIIDPLPGEDGGIRLGAAERTVVLHLKGSPLRRRV